MAVRRRIRGDRAFRRLLRKMPDAIRDEIATMLQHTGQQVLATQQAAVPRRSGRLARALAMRVTARGTRLRVGLIGAAANRIPYRNVIEFGQLAKTVQAVRRTRSGAVSRYAMRLPTKPARSFVFNATARRLMRDQSGAIRTFWEKVLTRASQGVTDA